MVSLTPSVTLGDSLSAREKGSIIPIPGHLWQALSCPIRWETSRRSYKGGCLLSFWKGSPCRKPPHPLQSLEPKLFVRSCGNGLWCGSAASTRRWAVGTQRIGRRSAWRLPCSLLSSSSRGMPGLAISLWFASHLFTFHGDILLRF